MYRSVISHLPMQVDSQWTNKDYTGAQKSSLYAMLWSIAAMVVGGLIVALNISLIAVGAAHETSSTGTGTPPENE